MLYRVAGCVVLLGLVNGTAWAATGSRLTDADAQLIVNEHNRVRRQAGVALAVTWDNGIAQYAQAWADHLAATGVPQHRQTRTYGENIFWGSGSYGVADAARYWESEKSQYHGEAIDSSNFSVFGHYTQMIWDKTTKIGCGMARGANGTIYIVCNYSPAGNVIGQRPVSGATPPGGAGTSSGGSTWPVPGSGMASGPRNPWLPGGGVWPPHNPTRAPNDFQSHLDEIRNRILEQQASRPTFPSPEQIRDSLRNARNRQPGLPPFPRPYFPHRR